MKTTLKFIEVLAKACACFLLIFGSAGVALLAAGSFLVWSLPPVEALIMPARLLLLLALFVSFWFTIDKDGGRPDWRGY